MQQKVCSQCGDKKELEKNFRRRIETIDGYVSECKLCEKKRRDKRKEEMKSVIKFY